jgi:hypothetical protein
MNKTKKDLNIPVTRKFLLDLANDIHNPKTKKFLHLCDGTLQNGPDPTNPKRPMHCGLGELYFAMTGLQPSQTHIDEDDVINLAAERCSLVAEVKANVNAVIAAANKLPDCLREETKDTLESAVEYYIEHDSKLDDFKNIIATIPEDNDDGNGDVCDLTIFKARSERVAKLLREAAKLLPK